MHRKPIRFRRGWRGREPGQIDEALDIGVVTELVRRGIAEYVTGGSVPYQIRNQNAKKQSRRR